MLTVSIYLYLIHFHTITICHSLVVTLYHPLPATWGGGGRRNLKTKNSGKLKGTVGAIEDRILQNKGVHH